MKYYTVYHVNVKATTQKTHPSPSLIYNNPQPQGFLMPTTGRRRTAPSTAQRPEGRQPPPQRLVQRDEIVRPGAGREPGKHTQGATRRTRCRDDAATTSWAVHCGQSS